MRDYRRLKQRPVIRVKRVTDVIRGRFWLLNGYPLKALLDRQRPGGRGLKHITSNGEKSRVYASIATVRKKRRRNMLENASVCGMANRHVVGA